jgi:urease accessory protein UreE
LARGTLLGECDCFLFDTPSVVIRVIERKEPVFVIVPQTPREWALFAYHVGNSHHPVMLTSDGIVCPDVPGMADMLRYHRIPFSKDLRAFTPVGQIPDHQHHVPR